MKAFDFFYNPRAGLVFLRVSLAFLMLLHGFSKLLNGTAGIEGMLAAAGLPAVLAYGVYLGELVAPLLLLAGPYTVPAALVVAFNMLVAVGLAHTGQVLQLTKSGGWALELQAMFFVAAVAIALLTPPLKKSA